DEVDDSLVALVVLNRQLPHQRARPKTPQSPQVACGGWAFRNLSWLRAGRKPSLLSAAKQSVVNDGPSSADFLVFTAGTDAIRKQSSDRFGRRVAPEARSGEAKVTKGFGARQRPGC